ncbi:hypothetical protein ACSSS7_005769 [Eimeria intestinalis]
MDLPGFYWDPERRRYFPLHSLRRPCSAVNPQPQHQQQQQHQQLQQQLLQQGLQRRQQQQELPALEADHQQHEGLQPHARRHGSHLGRQTHCTGIERLRFLQHRLKQRRQQRHGPCKRYRKQQQQQQQQGRQRIQPPEPFSERFSFHWQQRAAFHLGGLGKRRRSSSTSSKSSSGCTGGGSISSSSRNWGRSSDGPGGSLNTQEATICREKSSADIVLSTDVIAGGLQYVAAGPPRNLLWAIRRSRICGSNTNISSNNSWGGAHVKARAHATALQHLFLRLPLGFAPFVCLAGASACDPPQSQPQPSQEDRGCCSWQLLLSLGGEGGGRLLQIGASASYTSGAQAAAEAPAAAAAAEALAVARRAAGDSSVPGARPASASTGAPAGVQWLSGGPQQQQLQIQQREAEQLEARYLLQQREARGAASPAALPVTHAGAAVAYVGAAAGGRLVDVEAVGAIAVCCLRSSGTSRGALIVQQASSSTTSHLVWAGQNAAADAWACASDLAAAPSAAGAVAPSSPLFVLAGRQPAVQLLQGREGHCQLQQVWGPKGPAQRLVPRCCCAAAFSASDSAAAAFAGVALVGSTRGELLAVDPRCSTPSRLVQQQISNSDISCCTGSGISCIRVLKRHVAGVMVRYGVTGLQMLDLRFVSETPRLATHGRGMSACVLRDYRPARRQSNIGECSSSIRWQFACDEKEELVAAPFPSTSSSRTGSFLLFDVNKADCCREIAAAPAALAAADIGVEAPPFELFGCCCPLPRAAADFTEVFMVEQEVSIHPLHRGNCPPMFHSPAQQTRVCGLKPCCSEATAAAQQNQHRFDSLYGWECFCSEVHTLDEQKRRAISACCALLRLGGWPSPVQANQSIAAAAAAAGEVKGSVFVGASTWGLHVLAASPPLAS